MPRRLLLSGEALSPPNAWNTINVSSAALSPVPAPALLAGPSLRPVRRDAPCLPAAAYYLAHSLPGRARLRPLRPGEAAPGARCFSRVELAARLASPEALAARVEIRPCAATGGLLLTWAAALPARPATLPAVRPARTPRVVRNPIPGKLLSYVFPRLARFALAAAHAAPYIARGALGFIRSRSLTLDVLDASALLVCLARRDFRALGSITFFFALGEYMAQWTRKRSHDSLARSLALQISSVWVLADGEEREIPLARLREGDRVVVRAGGAIPADGTVVHGEGLVNQASMTGESAPVHRVPGHSVYAGTVLEEGVLHILAVKVGDEARINAILRYIDESESVKASIQGRYERVADAVVPYNFLLCGLVYALTRDPRRAGSVLLVDYSCALRLATPLAILAVMREAAELGVLIKGGKFAEALAMADAVVFDKTGTLTGAQPSLVDILPFGDLSRREILKIAACLEEHFPHPVGRAVVRAAEEIGLRHREEHAEVEYIVAHGIASRLNGQRVLIGSEHFLLEDVRIRISEAQRALIAGQTARGRSALYLTLDDELAGVLLIEDKIRPDAPAMVEALRREGMRVVMLTGDSRATAEAVAAQTGIGEYHAQLLPEQKAAFIRGLRAEGHTVLMIGDGVNDSPALSAAHVGCAMRGGADMALEVADVVLTSGDFGDLLRAREICRRLLLRLSGNFRTSLFWNSVFLLGGLSGLLTAGASAFLHNVLTSGIAVGSMKPLLDDEPAVERDALPALLPNKGREA